MNKSQFVKKLAGRTGNREIEMEKVVNAFLNIVGEELCKGNKVLFYGFGQFAPWEQTERIGRNVRTGEPHLIPLRTSVKFKVGKDLLGQLNPQNEKK